MPQKEQPPHGLPFDQRIPKRDPKELAETLANTMLQNRGSLLRKNPKLRPASPDDVEALSRLTGQTIDEFNAMLSTELRGVAQDIMAVIKRKLAADEFKSGELAFLFSVMQDKRMAMDGRNQVQNAAINIQINQHGTQLSKEDLISMLEGRQKPAEIIEAEAVPESPPEQERKAG